MKTSRMECMSELPGMGALAAVTLGSPELALVVPRKNRKKEPSAPAHATAPLVQEENEKLATPESTKPIAVLSLNGNGYNPTYYTLGIEPSGKLHLNPTADADFNGLSTGSIVDLPTPRFSMSRHQPEAIYSLGLGATEVQVHGSWQTAQKTTLKLELTRMISGQESTLSLSPDEFVDLFLGNDEQQAPDPYDRASFFVIPCSGYHDLLGINLNDEDRPVYIIIGPEPDATSFEELSPKSVVLEFLDSIDEALVSRGNYVVEEVHQAITQAMQDGLIKPNSADVVATHKHQFELMVRLYRIKALLLAHSVKNVDDPKLHYMVPFLRYYEQHPVFRRLQSTLGGAASVTLSSDLLTNLTDTLQTSNRPRHSLSRLPSKSRSLPITEDEPHQDRWTHLADEPVSEPESDDTRLIFDDTESAPATEPSVSKPPIQREATQKMDKEPQSTAKSRNTVLELISEPIPETKEGIVDSALKLIEPTLGLFPPGISKTELLANHALLQSVLSTLYSLVERYQALPADDWESSPDYVGFVPLLDNFSNHSVFWLTGRELALMFHNDLTLLSSFSRYTSDISYLLSSGMVGTLRAVPELQRLSSQELLEQAKSSTNPDVSENYYDIRTLLDNMIWTSNPTVETADIILKCQYLITVQSALKLFRQQKNTPRIWSAMVSLKQSLEKIVQFDKEVRDLDYLQPAFTEL